jgi:hypothetical protein
MYPGGAWFFLPRPGVQMRSLAYRGTLDFDDGADTALLVAHLAECLRCAGAASVKTAPAAVSFRGGLFRVRPWHMLVAFDHGELIVDESTHEVHYALSMQQLAIAAALMLLWAGEMAWSDTKHSLAVPFFVVFGWLWLVGANVLFAAPRFKDFLRKAVDSSPG